MSATETPERLVDRVVAFDQPSAGTTVMACDCSDCTCTNMPAGETTGFHAMQGNREKRGGIRSELYTPKWW